MQPIDERLRTACLEALAAARAMAEDDPGRCALVLGNAEEPDLLTGALVGLAATLLKVLGDDDREEAVATWVEAAVGFELTAEQRQQLEDRERLLRLVERSEPWSPPWGQ